MGVATALGRFAATASELVLGSVCAGCDGAPGLLCGPCRESLRGPARWVPAAVPVPVTAVAAYAGPAKAIVLAHKEHGRLALAAPLGDALATATVQVLEGGEGCPGCGARSVRLVPVPSARPVVRRRGHDPLARATRRASAVLRKVGYDCTVVPALRQRRVVADQAGLDAAARRTNLAAALGVRPAGRRLLAGRCVVLIDDIVTTGATLGEAVRALVAEGVPVCGAAVVAATARRTRSLGVHRTDAGRTG
jgi:predicted amidophosphoribosyltransferase